MKTFLQGLSLLSLFVTSACGGSATRNDAAAATAKTQVATAAAGDLTVTLLSDGPLATGLNRLYVRVENAVGAPVVDAAVSLLPMMSMSNGKQHTCPMLGVPTVDADGLYRVDVVFQMASSDVDTWSATVGLTLSDGTTAEASMPLPSVPDSGRVKSFSYTDPVSSVATSYVASMSFASAPAVGLNPIIFTLHAKQDMMTFPSVDDAALSLDPEMPSMGHGSPGSQDPVLSAPGRYEGKLSFSMAGEWQTTVTIGRAGSVIGAPVFIATF